MILLRTQPPCVRAGRIGHNHAPNVGTSRTIESLSHSQAQQPAPAAIGLASVQPPHASLIDIKVKFENNKAPNPKGLLVALKWHTISVTASVTENRRKTEKTEKRRVIIPIICFTLMKCEAFKVGQMPDNEPNDFLFGTKQSIRKISLLFFLSFFYQDK